VGTVIDASVLVAAERGALDIERVLARYGDQEIALAAVTVSELLHGVHRAPAGRRRVQREAFIERLLEHLPVLPFDLVAARLHARVWAELAAKGVAVGERDLMIVSTAMSRGHEVATRDARSFPRIPGLRVVSW
jgi:predicted nucleic acid-binding protein